MPGTGSSGCLRDRVPARAPPGHLAGNPARACAPRCERSGLHSEPRKPRLDSLRGLGRIRPPPYPRKWDLGSGNSQVTELLLAPFQIAIRACFLGFVFGCGMLLSFSQSSWSHFGWYMCSLSLFHYSEYLVTAVNNPKSLSLDSFLLNHSLEYTVAALSSWIEFTLENIFWPELKQITWLSALGLLMVVFGECLRKAAMFTAGSNFNHVVQNEKSETHTLVTSGVYAWFRHPSYVGWFYWSIGTQVMLCNPICGVGYALTVWRFFRDRTEEEEISLIHFFGDEYLEYKKRVPTGLPFIKGVKVEL
ncbi:protein-S-isoprenylcysteine O-methyltransferase [Suricata suricatta]|uniref:protein-S-isoprenylcysteine O-methyltransferase n=1 Tax=Suricata suricatta TaxID=37032 RepID=UPI001155465A|nr:protein-S-isoprenylcysteine O-methyltransferase [Suricata suricatta]